MVSPASRTPSALQTLLLDEIARVTQHPRHLLTPDWDLDLDLRLDWVMKGQLLESLIRNAALEPPKANGSAFHFDDLHTVDDVIELVTGNGRAYESAAREREAFPLPILEMAGTPFEMGFLHASSQGPAIRRVMRKLADIIGPKLENLPELEDVLEKRDRYFSPAELEELEGAAEALGLPVRHMIALNVGLYPEYLPGCTQFAITARRNGNAGLVHAVNEDSPVALMLREDLTRIMQIRRPKQGLDFVTFSIAGQIGGLNGINEAGIAVSSTILLDCPFRQETRYGCIHPILVRRVLEQADSLEAAVDLVKNSERAGGWSLCISQASRDRLCYLEYDGPRLAMHRDLEHLATANHCRLLQPVAKVPEHSRHRLKRLNELLDRENQSEISVPGAQKILRDGFDPSRGRETRFPTMSTLRRVDNQASIVMSPAKGELWTTPGPNEANQADRYYRLDVGTLLGIAESRERRAESQTKNASGVG